MCNQKKKVLENDILILTLIINTLSKYRSVLFNRGSAKHLMGFREF